MATIGFILALLFAIPTYGLSLLVYFGLMVAGRLMKEKARMHHADKLRAMRKLNDTVTTGKMPTKFAPTWSVDRQKADIFLESVIKGAIASDIPEGFIFGLFEDNEFIRLLMIYVANLESEGSSFFEQQLASVDFVETAWNKVGSEKKSDAPTFDW